MERKNASRSGMLLLELMMAILIFSLSLCNNFSFRSRRHPNDHLSIDWSPLHKCQGLVRLFKRKYMRIHSEVCQDKKTTP